VQLRIRKTLLMAGGILFGFAGFASDIPTTINQGSLVIGKVLPGQQVAVAGKTLKLTPDNRFVFGVGRDAAPSLVLTVTQSDGKINTHNVNVTQREYDIQRIDGLPAKMVSPPESVLKRIKNDNYQVAIARKTDSQEQGFLENFIWPAEGRISGIYGSQRILNDVPKRPHYGIDVAAPVGTPVIAPAAGVVTLAVPDMYYSGGTLLIDHGYGVSSTFIHLDKIHVKVGQQVTQGQRIADIGATGRVTGAHLDWRINWFTERLDPEFLVPSRR
jgi:murein DD-endopeptidase MepM/ murein hydrolase activator NlpD